MSIRFWQMARENCRARLAPSLLVCKSLQITIAVCILSSSTISRPGLKEALEVRQDLRPAAGNRADELRGLGRVDLVVDRELADPVLFLDFDNAARRPL